MNAQTVVEFGKILTKAHRAYGQYKRILGKYTIAEPIAETFEDFIGYKSPKKITAGSIRNLQKAMSRMERKKEHLIYTSEEKTAERELPRLVGEIKKELNLGYGVVSGSNKLAKAGASALNVAVMSAIDTGVEKNGAIDIYAGVKEFYARYGHDLQRYAYSVIDTGTGGFNTNEVWYVSDVRGRAGRKRFRDYTEKLLTAFGVPELVDDIMLECGMQ